jgi:hypothetical protein
MLGALLSEVSNIRNGGRKGIGGEQNVYFQQMRELLSCNCDEVSTKKYEVRRGPGCRRPGGFRNASAE